MPKLRDVIMVNFGDINVALAEAGGDINVALAGTRLMQPKLLCYSKQWMNHNLFWYQLYSQVLNLRHMLLSILQGD